MATEKELALYGYTGFHPKEPTESKAGVVGLTPATSGYVGFGAEEAKVGAGPSENKGPTPDELTQLSKSELKALAEQYGLNVRSSKKGKAPLKVDYVRALKRIL